MNKDRLKAELFDDEGFKPYVYKDSLDFDTIGIGRLCDRRKIGSGLTKDEALYLLENDINKCIKLLDSKLPWWNTLTDARQRALVNMTFQLGINGLIGFVNSLEALRTAKTQQDYGKAADMFMQSKWAKQTPNRALRVTEMIRYG